jgi:hypothetical protein
MLILQRICHRCALPIDLPVKILRKPGRKIMDFKAIHSWFQSISGLNTGLSYPSILRIILGFFCISNRKVGLPTRPKHKRIDTLALLSLPLNCRFDRFYSSKGKQRVPIKSDNLNKFIKIIPTIIITWIKGK